MTTLTTYPAIEQTAGTIGESPTTPVYAVVGFDGSAPAIRALDGAARLLHGRAGSLEVVFVAHVSALEAMGGFPVGAAAEILNGFDEASRHLGTEVREQLASTEQRWHFQRRDGAIADELIAAAKDLRGQHDPDAAVVIVVGRSGHRYHRVVGSVTQALEWRNDFPVIVIP
ncbi:MAG TPA: universal stress protein [Streptosporangiaceae bacterium]|jgi:nucleotide-binding universal stress UspA family protein|nr:universal stress protein [Streptosporangiaceae bacterium]